MRGTFLVWWQRSFINGSPSSSFFFLLLPSSFFFLPLPSSSNLFKPLLLSNSEHNIWGKHTNFELGTRVPLIISSPGIPAGVSSSLVESVDLYPTIAAVAGIPNPPDLDGVDLTPLLLDPSKTIKEAVYSEYVEA